MRLPRLRMLNVVSNMDTQLADFLPFESHLLLSKTTRMVYSHHSKQASRRGADLRGSGITIKVSSLYGSADPLDWFSGVPPTSFGQIKNLTLSGSLDPVPPYTSGLPITAFENLEVLEFKECTVRPIESIARTLSPRDGKGIPCRSLREIRCDSWVALKSLTWFVEGRKLAGNRVRLVYFSDAEAP
jgi:hypothetical protein